jgi:hypothetical protein
MEAFCSVTTNDQIPGVGRTAAVVFPENWDALPATALGSVQTGPFGTVLKASEYSRLNGVPIISVGEIGEGRIQLNDKTPFAPIEVTKRLPAYILREGDIVFGRKGAVDRTCLVQSHEDGWFLGSDGIRLRPSKMVEPKFLAAQLQLGSVRNWLTLHATGTTMATLSRGVLHRLMLQLPPLPEQHAIAGALSDTDALMASLDALIAKKRDLKQAAQQQLLTGKARLSGFDVNVGYKQTELGSIPRDWRCLTVAELAARKPNAIVGGPFGSDLVAQDYVTFGVPVIRGQNMCGPIVSGEFVYVSQAKSKRLGANTAIPGDIILRLIPLAQVAL